MKNIYQNSCRDEQSLTSLEKSFQQAMTPFEEFVRDQASSGLVLMAMTICAMVIANSGLNTLYQNILHTPVTIGGGIFSLTYSLHHWINDGLMAIFFFIVGLEIKREIMVGELADRKQAILPIAAAIGGMVTPALIYTAINFGSDAVNGWGIPMATDIAFAVGVLTLLGKRIPKALVGFLLALAIVDDLGAVLVIAAFYTEQIRWIALFAAGVIFALLNLANRAGIRHPFPYGILGILLWLCFLKSGVHATLAGVLTALTIPAGPYCTVAPFVEKMKELSTEFYDLHVEGVHIMKNGRQQKILQSMENIVNKMESPLQRMEHHLHVWVSFLIIPVFALANAGIPIEMASLGPTLLQPVTIGVMMGLIFGKLIGIFTFSWLVIKLGWSHLPAGVTMQQIAGVSLLAGIGFTMSIFIAGLAFDNEVFLLNAKIGILAASLLAGICGYLALKMTTSTGDER